MTTLQLYDDDENYWQTKLHVGCGGIYLTGYLNIDAQGKHTSEVSQQELRHNIRSIMDYYQDGGDPYWGNLPQANQIIADIICPMQELNRYFLPRSVNKIIAIQTMEHLDPIEFLHTADLFYTMLQTGGHFIVSVPDMDESLKWLNDSIHPFPNQDLTKFIIRHLGGSKKDAWSTHRSWWTNETLKKVLEWVGFKNIQGLLNFHCYPAIVLKASKYD
jgi:predicted SAM-dependent methyltransferase